MYTICLNRASNLHTISWYMEIM